MPWKLLNAFSAHIFPTASPDMPPKRRRRIVRHFVIALAAVGLLLAIWSWQRSNEIDARFVGTWHMREEGPIWLNFQDNGISKYMTSTAIGSESKWWIADRSLCIEYNAHPPFWQKMQRVIHRLSGSDPANVRFPIIDIQQDEIRLQFSNGKPLTLVREDVPSH